MPRGPFASTAGVGRAEPPWNALNRCDEDVTGTDARYESWRASLDASDAPSTSTDAPEVTWTSGFADLDDAYDVVVVDVD